MEQNYILKQCDQKLKKFIEKSIHRKELINCSSIMSRKKLRFFYQQMQDKFYLQNIKKVKKQRRFSLGNQLTINLEDKQYVKIVTQPEYARSKQIIKCKTNQKFKLQNVHTVKREKLDSQKGCYKRQDQDEINYFVKRVKNPKAVRYISLKPIKWQNKQNQNLIKLNNKSPVKKVKYCGITNYKQRETLINKLKKTKHYRNSCIQL